MKVIIVFSAFLLISCSGKKNNNPMGSIKQDTSFTAVKLALNIFTNDYKDITALRVIKDTTIYSFLDSSNGKITQQLKVAKDTSYMGWWPYIVTDSTNRAIKNKAGSDSVIYRWTPIEKRIIIQDYNRNFK